MTAAAQSNVIPFAFEDSLVRVVQRGEEPWFVGKDVCQVLEIRDHSQALNRLDEDERGGCTVPTPGGPQEVVVISEPGVFRLIFTSRKAEAERFKRWLAHEVLPQLRRTGRFDMNDEPADIVGSDPLAVVTAKLALVREARMLFGHQQARTIWKQLNLPTIPLDEAETPIGEAMHVLWTILGSDPGVPGKTVKSLLLDAMDDDDTAKATLKLCGVRPMEMDGEPGFWIANRARHIAQALEGTGWAKMTWRLALKRLSGARSGGVHSTDGFAQAGVWLPERYLDIRTEEVARPA